MASPVRISEVQRKAHLPLPTVVRREDWSGQFDHIPWRLQNRYIPAGSWVKIVGELDGKGQLGYVIGSSLENDHIIVAVVPHLVSPSRTRPGSSVHVSHRERLTAAQEELDAAHSANVAARKKEVELMRAMAHLDKLQLSTDRKIASMTWEEGDARRKIEQELKAGSDTRRDTIEMEMTKLKRAVAVADGTLATRIELTIKTLQTEVQDMVDHAAHTIAKQIATYKTEVTVLRQILSDAREEVEDMKKQVKKQTNNQHRRTGKGHLRLFDPAIYQNACPDKIVEISSEQVPLPQLLAHKLTGAIISNDLQVTELEMNLDEFEWAFDWTLEPRLSGNLFQYGARFYLHGLLLVPVFTSNEVDLVPVPSVNQLQLFVDSAFHPRIDRIFSVLHWKRGDLIKHEGVNYTLDDVSLGLGNPFVTARKVILSAETERPFSPNT